MRLASHLILAALTAATVLVPTVATAAPDRRIGIVQSEPARRTGNVADVAVTHWVGRDFVFLEKPRLAQATGYAAFTVAERLDAPEAWTNHDGSLRYQPFVGKTITAVSVDAHPTRRGEYQVTFSEPETGLMLLASTFSHSISDVVHRRDVDQAKARWLGQTLYATKGHLATYDDRYDTYGQIPVHISEPLKVVDVIAGLDAIKPIWIVVERRNGERGFIATSYSWTNVYADWWRPSRPWAGQWADLNPKEWFFANNEQSERRVYAQPRAAATVFTR